VEQHKMKDQLYIPVLYRKGFDLNTLPSDLINKCEDVLNWDKSQFNAQIQLLDLTLWNAIKSIHPNNPLVISVNKMQIGVININENNGFNTIVDMEDTEPAVKVNNPE